MKGTQQFCSTESIQETCLRHHTTTIAAKGGPTKFVLNTNVSLHSLWKDFVPYIKLSLSYLFEGSWVDILFQSVEKQEEQITPPFNLGICPDTGILNTIAHERDNLLLVKRLCTNNTQAVSHHVQMTITSTIIPENHMCFEDWSGMHVLPCHSHRKTKIGKTFFDIAVPIGYCFDLKRIEQVLTFDLISSTRQTQNLFSVQGIPYTVQLTSENLSQDNSFKFLWIPDNYKMW